ncbi:MAG: hypothetical protein ACRETH_06715 [Steroidobacteraceae bacterium]
MGEPGKCRSCQADILWVVMKVSGKRMPLDAKPQKFVVVDLDDDSMQDRGWMRDCYTSHFATCPNAARHRMRELPRAKAP